MRLIDFHTKLLLNEGKAGTFVGAQLTKESEQQLAQWMEEKGIQNPTPVGDIHCTIVISKTEPIEYAPEMFDPEIEIDPDSYQIAKFGPEKNVLVLKFRSPELERRHRIMRKRYGMSWDFDEYIPHVTLSYYGGDLDEVPDFPLVFRREYTNPFDPPKSLKETIDYDYSDMNGFWITDKGEILEVDHKSNIHHPDVVMDYYGPQNFFDSEEEMHDDYAYEAASDHAHDVALGDGWIRVTTIFLQDGGSVTIDAPTPSKQAIQTLMRWIRQVDPEITFTVITGKSFKADIDARQVPRVLREEEKARIDFYHSLESMDITEGVNEILYHTTFASNAVDILQQNRFRLTPDMGTPSDRDYRREEKNFFLSTTRSRMGQYHTPVSKYEDSRVIMVLDGRKLMQDGYSGGPVDYWNGFDIDEMEDRVYSNSPTIDDAKKYIKEIHLFTPEKSRHDLSGRMEPRSKASRTLIGLAKRMGMPLYTYKDPKNFNLLNKSRAGGVSVKDFGKDEDRIPFPDSENAETQMYRGRSQPSNFFASWTELLMKPAHHELTDRAKRMLQKINRYETDAVRELESDIHNAKTGSYRPSFDKFWAYMKRIGLRSPDQVVDHIKEKYGLNEAITEAPKPWLRRTDTMVRTMKDIKCQVIVSMNPMTFLRLTTRNETDIRQIMANSASLKDYNRSAKAGHDDNFRKQINVGKTKDDEGYLWGNIHMPWLNIQFNDDGSEARVSGHEGRHRAAALVKAGVDHMEVALCMRPGRDMLSDVPFGPEYHMTAEHIPEMIESQFNKSLKISTSNWKVIEDDMQKRTRNR